MEKISAHNENDNEVINNILAVTEAILKGDFQKRIVSNVHIGNINKIATNLNLISDQLLLNPPPNYSEQINIHQFIEVITSFANHNFSYKLPISENGTILDAIATGINLLGDDLEQSTASKHELEIANEAIIKNQNSLKQAQKIAKIGSWELDVSNMEFSWSDEHYRIFELKKEIIKNLWEAFIIKIHPDDYLMVKAQFKNAIENETNFQFEFRIICKNKSIKYIQVTGEVFRKLKHNTIFRGTTQDITERKNAEEEINKSLIVVIEQNKRLVNFSYIVSHNLRSHTCNIQAILDFLTISDSEDEKKELMQHLQTSSNLLNETINNLNEVVSIQKNINLNTQSLNINYYINNVLEILNTQIASKKAVINNHIAADVTLFHNPAYLESILLNFISNAIKYAHRDRNLILAIDTYIENNYRVVTFTDNGIGIDLIKNGESLFGIFKTFHENPDARGIGLFITKSQIEALQGKVEAESELDKGTTFKVYFKIPN